MTRYAVEPRERQFFKGYGFLSIAKNLGTRFGDKLLKQGQETAKIVGKRALNKTAEATGDLIGNKIADKITATQSNRSAQPKQIPPLKQIPPEKRQQIIDELRLIPGI